MDNKVFRVGDVVAWNDPGIMEFSEEDRQTQMERRYEIVSIDEEIILIADEYGEAEVTADELVLYNRENNV